MPPMLDIALYKLSARTERNLRAHCTGFGVNERHHILQLIPKAVRAARLVIAASRPQTASQRLIDEPAVGQDVQRGVGRFDLYRAERMPPMLQHRFKGFMRDCNAAKALHQRDCRLDIVCSTEA